MIEKIFISEILHANIIFHNNNFEGKLLKHYDCLFVGRHSLVIIFSIILPSPVRLRIL